MAWNGTHTWTVGEILTAGNMNTYVNDNLAYLKTMVAAQIQLFGASLKPSTTSGATGPTQVEMSTNKVNISGMSYLNGVQGNTEASIDLPADYGGGTMTALFKWCANSASTNSVIWGIQGVSVTDNGALDVAFGTEQEVTDANQGTYKKNISAATGAITFAGTPAAGKDLHLRIYRKGSGSDNLAVPAILEKVVLTYTRT